jgi:hypothetical protein
MDAQIQPIYNMSTPGYLYRNEKEPYNFGWILLCIGLTIALIVFITLWAFSINSQHNNQVTQAFGPYGVQPGVDANQLNQCGINNNDPCVFLKNTLADCETECNILSKICDAFTFNFSTSTMKIVDKNAAFASPSVNLFVRQQ